MPERFVSQRFAESRGHFRGTSTQLKGSVQGRFRVLRAAWRDKTGAEFNRPWRVHLAKDPSPLLSPHLGVVPGGIQLLNVPTGKALVCLIKPFEVVHRQLSVLLSFPGSPEREIAFELIEKNFFERRFNKQREARSGAPETDRGMRNIKEAKRAQMTEERRVSVQVVRKICRPSLPSVHVGEGEDRGGRTGRGVKVHWELIDEVAEHRLTRRRDLGGPGWKKLLGDAQLVREKADFILLRFEVIVCRVRQDEIKEQQAHADKLRRMGITMTQIFAVGHAIDGP